MEKEVLYQLLLEVCSPNFKKQLHAILNFPSDVMDCFDDRTLNELQLVKELVRDSNEQLAGLSNMLIEALNGSKRPHKYEKFYQALQKNIPNSSGSNGLVKFQKGTREQMLFRCLAQYYHRQCGAASSISFNSLVSDDLLASLLARNALTEADMTALDRTDCRKDTALLSVLIVKPGWPQRLITALIQSGMLQVLDQILPAFQQLFASNFDTSLTDTRAQLSASGDDRRAACSQIEEALDLYFCMNYASLTTSHALDHQQQAASSSGDLPVDPIPTGAFRSSLDQQLQQLAPMEFKAPQQRQQQSEPSPSKQIKLSDLGDLDLDGDCKEEADDDAEAQESGRLQMRVYQEELASSGVAGLNSVIIAPTGSGKTLVSIRIATARLTEDPTGSARVCFLADRKHLVEQQCAAFKAQLPPEFRNKVVCVTGGEGDRAPLSFQLRQHSVLLVSTQILLNSLKDKSEDGLNGDLTKFRLIVFDECHNCSKDHPSNKIMEFYFQCKEQLQQRPGGSRLPQIIGLTASPGTGQAQRAVEAEKHILRLCASLDCQRLVTVRRCAESLQSHVNNPRVRLHRTGRKDDDPVRRCLDQLMDLAEQGLASACERNGHPAPVPPARNSFLYTNFCGTLRSRLAARFVEAAAAWRRLHHCNVATLLWSLFRCTDALHYIEEHLCDTNVLDRKPTCQLDAELRDLLQQRLLPQMRAHCASSPVTAGRSPALARLRQILAEQFECQPDSRALVFVQQRCFTGVVKSFLDGEATELIQAGVRIGVMTGANASGDSGGITQIGQSDLLADFRRGTVKILISTSVTEEGLDVQKCNAVVRFCHVTNEIAMVQSRGRGRAEGSVYHVIVPDEMSWLDDKERLNQARDAMMLEAVAQLGDLAQEEFARRVQAEQRLLRDEARQQRQLRAVVANANRGASFSIVCFHCARPLTSSDRLRLAQGCHRLALDAELLTSRLNARREGASKSFTDYAVLGVALLCRNCGTHVANLCRFKELAFPELKIQAIIFVNTKTGEQHGPLKQWKLVQRFLTEVEIENQDLIGWASIVPEIPVQNLLETE